MDEGKVLVLHEMWMAGASAEEIGRRFGIAYTTVYKWAQKYKLPPRRQWHGNPVDPTPEEIAERARECRERHLASKRAEDVRTTQDRVSARRRRECLPR